MGDMNILLFGFKLNQCTTEEEKTALYAAYPEFARRHEENIAARAAEDKRRMPNGVPPMRVSKSIDVDGKREIGSIVEHDGRKYRVESHFHLTPKEVHDLEEINDVYMDAGWYSHAVLVEK